MYVSSGLCSSGPVRFGLVISGLILCGGLVSSGLILCGDLLCIRLLCNPVIGPGCFEHGDLILSDLFFGLGASRAGLSSAVVFLRGMAPKRWHCCRLNQSFMVQTWQRLLLQYRVHRDLTSLFPWGLNLDLSRDGISLVWKGGFQRLGRNREACKGNDEGSSSNSE